jgi:hypothetical protein
MRLHDTLDSVSDAQSFLVFARQLALDRAEATTLEVGIPSDPRGPDAGGWENTTIEGFLEAAIAWAEATDLGLTQGIPVDNQWKRFATFLYCGKIYE